jgi:predicted dehydrogenase
MNLGFDGRSADGPRIRAGFIGCGSHAFRNIYPVLRYVPIDLVAVCDIDLEKAKAYAKTFGAERAYGDHREMLASERLDVVFVVTSYDERGRPRYPALAIDCLGAGCHVFIEKPPAASCEEIDRMRDAARRADRNVVVGLKKMFFPATEKAKELTLLEEFGPARLVTLQYPQFIPPAEDIRRYRSGENLGSVVGFLDHLCHPVSLLLFLAGMPKTLFYARSSSGAGSATFGYGGDLVASLALTSGASQNGGMERTVIVSERGCHIVVDNNVRVSLHRTPPDLGYGTSASFYRGTPEQTTATWEPEFSLGQPYNKGLFLLGYYGEVDEMCRSILEKRAPRKGTLDHAWQATRIFEAFAQGPDRLIELQ